MPSVVGGCERVVVASSVGAAGLTYLGLVVSGGVATGWAVCTGCGEGAGGCTVAAAGAGAGAATVSGGSVGVGASVVVGATTNACMRADCGAVAIEVPGE